MMDLSDMGVKKAKARERAYSMSDGGGLYLWVKPNGGKRVSASNCASNDFHFVVAISF
jgi:hypothetical protein